MKIFFLLLSFLLATATFAQNLIIKESGRYTDGREGGSEIVTYDSATQQLFITNFASDSIDIVSIADPGHPVKTGGIDITPYGGNVNSVVSLNNGYIAAAIEAAVKQDPGFVVFFDAAGNYITKVMVGSLPDMVTYAKNSQKVLVANEGEPNDAYTNDPLGSVAIIDIGGGVPGVGQSDVTILDFSLAPQSIAGSLHKPGTSFAQDLEPEYIAVDESASRAVVGCQEGNLFVFIDLTTNTITEYKGLGFKDHNIPENSFDASDKDGVINIRNWPVHGAYMPDALASYQVGGLNYWVSANEGDSRDYSGYSSETRIKELTLDATVFPDAAILQADEAIGRLKTLTADMAGDTDGDGDVDVLYSYGARSFSIWDDSGMLVWDSGNDIETYISTNHPSFFNCEDGLASEKDKRSDDKGAEVEAVAVGKVGGKYYAFAGLERQGGFMVYDITNPVNPEFVTFVHSYDEANGTMTDIAPEGIVFVPAEKSPTGKNMLLVSNELSGTTTIYEIWDIVSNREDNEKNEVNVLVCPNPVGDQMVVSVTGMGSAPESYTITSSSGKAVMKGLFNTQKKNISTTSLQSGIYFLTLTINNESIVTRFVKQ